MTGRGGFGEVYGCRKADTGKMYAMKCLDKKRIKMKQGETLALNERIMLSLVSTGQDCPFIVCMTYAFHTPDKLCFILGKSIFPNPLLFNPFLFALLYVPLRQKAF